MKTETEAGALIITLPSECTISHTEAHLKKIRSGLSEKPERIEIRADGAETVDTAYLQLILSLKASAEKWEIPFSVSENDSEIRRVSELYGIEL